MKFDGWNDDNWRCTEDRSYLISEYDYPLSDRKWELEHGMPISMKKYYINDQKGQVQL